MTKRRRTAAAILATCAAIGAVTWLHIWARQASLETEEQTRKCETCYREGIVLATDALDDLQTELAVLAGKVQERGDREGEQAALRLWAEGLREILKTREVIVIGMGKITPPERYREFHGLLIQRETKQNDFQAEVLRILESDDGTFRKRIRALQADEDSIQRDLDRRLVKAARDAGLAVP